jgi:beta-glucosidase
METTCVALTAYLVRHHDRATCTVWDKPPNTTTVLLHDLPQGTYAHPLSKSVTWIAPTTGPFVVNNQTYGDSSVTLNGKALMAQPGIAEVYEQNEVTIDAVAGHHYLFKEVWGNHGPTLTIGSVAAHVNVGVAAAAHADSALILADDYTAEGADKDELGLPEGQDALISAVEAKVPTSVALFTTGPVVMPWLSSKTRSLIEFWNPGGNPPFGTAFSDLVPAYGAVLTGLVSPQGHLPITFPANQAESPIDLGTGSNEFAFWPGDNGTANLDLAPLNGEVIGYGWYQEKGWPVLFPFGFGLTYATMTQSFDTANTSCAANDSTTEICLPVAVRLKLPTSVQAVDGVQVYVAQPQVTGGAPQLLLGDAQSVECRFAGIAGVNTGSCASPNDVDLTISATDVGQWNSTTQSYEFTNGCYEFVVAPNSQVAYRELASPTSYPADDVVNTTFPFSASTTLTPGACPG